MNFKSYARVYLHSFKVKYNPMVRKIHFRENWLIFWWIWGEAEIILRILGANEKYFQGGEEFSFRDLGRSMHYFQRSREHRPPCGAHYSAHADIIVHTCGLSRFIDYNQMLSSFQ